MKPNRTVRIRAAAGILLLAVELGRAQSGTKLWEYATGDAILSSPALTAGGVLYVGSYDQYLHAIDAATGARVWKFPTDPAKPNLAGYIYASPAVGPDGTIYFGTEERNFSTGSGSGNLYALNPNGTLKWKFPTGAAIYSDPAIGADGTIYFGCFDTYLYAVNPSGTQKWRFKAADTIFSDAAVAADGTVYFGCDDHNLYALTSGGAKKWTFDTGGPITAAPVIAPDGTVYVGTTSSQKFFAVGPDGAKKWEFQTVGRIYSSAALGADGTIYFGSEDSHLYALKSDGTLQWQFRAGGAVRSSPAIAADGTVYFGCEDHQLYALNASGGMLWNMATANYVYSSPVIGPNGAVYFGSADHQLYAVGGASALATTAWPMLHHDSVHSGRAITVTPTDAPPTISNVADQTIAAGGVSDPLPIHVGDAETSAADLRLSGASSNPTLVPQSNIAFAGSGTERTVTLTPAANQTGSATITITVTDAGGNSAATSFLLTVTAMPPANRSPTLALIPDAVIDEGVAFVFTATASDPDAPSQALTFSLASAPAGASIDPNTGVFWWTPSETEGPDTFPITVVVSDNGSPGLSASQTFSLQVREVNTPPVLQPIPDKTVQPGTTLSLTAIATDTDVPANRLTFRLVNAPPGAQLDPATGAFNWTPTATQANTTNQVTISVADDATPSLSSQVIFAVAVVQAVVAAPTIQAVQISGGALTLTWNAISGRTYRVQYTSDLPAGAWVDLAGDVQAVGAAATKADNAAAATRRFYRIVLLP